MKISTIRIQKFRSIEDATIIMDQVLALVGANNVGKSHVLRALNAFFNFAQEREFFLKRDHAFSLKARPRITVTFTDIRHDDGVSPRYIYNNRMTIIFTYRWDRNNPTYAVFAGTNKQTIDLETFGQLVSHYHGIVKFSAVFKLVILA